MKRNSARQRVRVAFLEPGAANQLGPVEAVAYVPVATREAGALLGRELEPAADDERLLEFLAETTPEAFVVEQFLLLQIDPLLPRDVGALDRSLGPHVELLREAALLERGVRKVPERLDLRLDHRQARVDPKLVAQQSGGLGVEVDVLVVWVTNAPTSTRP